MDANGELKQYYDAVELHDDITGELLDPVLVQVGGQEELKRFADMHDYDYAQRGSIPVNSHMVNVRWVHVNKGSVNEPKVRCRLVAQELKRGKRDEFYAATPPLEAKKMLFFVSCGLWVD